MENKILTAKAITLYGLKFTAWELAMKKLNKELYDEYKAQFEKLKAEHKSELDTLDSAISESEQ